MAFLGVFILWGCPNNVTPPEPDTLEPVKTEYNVGAEGGEFTISFRTNLEYKVRTDANWLEATAVTKAVETKTATVKVKPYSLTAPLSILSDSQAHSGGTIYPGGHGS